jgi:hypothetical protein
LYDKEVGRRVIIPLLLLVLLAVPVGNAWCATVCEAMAISSGCAHTLQPADDLPLAKAEPVVVVVSTPVIDSLSPPERAYSPVFLPVAQLTPLRL